MHHEPRAPVPWQLCVHRWAPGWGRRALGPSHECPGNSRPNWAAARGLIGRRVASLPSSSGSTPVAQSLRPAKPSPVVRGPRSCVRPGRGLCLKFTEVGFTCRRTKRSDVVMQVSPRLLSNPFRHEWPHKPLPWVRHAAPAPVCLRRSPPCLQPWRWAIQAVE